MPDRDALRELVKAYSACCEQIGWLKAFITLSSSRIAKHQALQQLLRHERTRDYLTKKVQED